MKHIFSIGTILLIVITITLLSSSCAPAYVPNVVNTPMLSNKGEFQGAINLGIAGVDPQISYAISDNIGIMVNGSFRNYTSDSTSDNYHKHQFLEMGIGYYKKFGKIGSFETFGGYGLGKLQANVSDDYWDSYANVIMNRLFLQPSIGLTTQIFDANFSPRFVFINLQQEQGGHKTGKMIEPVLTFRLGYRYLKGSMQFGLSLPFASEDVPFNYQPFIFSIGMQVILGRKYDKE